MTTISSSAKRNIFKGYRIDAEHLKPLTNINEKLRTNKNRISLSHLNVYVGCMGATFLDINTVGSKSRLGAIVQRGILALRSQAQDFSTADQVLCRRKESRVDLR